VRADLHALTVAPQLPAAWDFAELDNLAFGAHVVSLRVTPAHLRFEHVSGPTPLEVTYKTPDGKTTRFAVEPGQVCKRPHMCRLPPTSSQEAGRLPRPPSPAGPSLPGRVRLPRGVVVAAGSPRGVGLGLPIA
jgi:hypothetical protein